MKVARATYKNDKYYRPVCRAVCEVLRRGLAVAPIEVFIEMGLLHRDRCADWRFGRVPYLERVITCNLSKANRILRILGYHALDLGLKPSDTAYVRWGKGGKARLRFSKSGDAAVEAAYSRHYLAARKKNTETEARGSETVVW